MRKEYLIRDHVKKTANLKHQQLVLNKVILKIQRIFPPAKK